MYCENEWTVLLSRVQMLLDYDIICGINCSDDTEYPHCQGQNAYYLQIFVFYTNTVASWKHNKKMNSIQKANNNREDGIDDYVKSWLHFR
mmetsp:Transcript_14595/g.20266  ORF Transcript_14595/g.20266 Transcript_14595/m.20266 type:complete len:90 (+) Transcript_14595:161-430(+)